MQHNRKTMLAGAIAAVLIPLGIAGTATAAPAPATTAPTAATTATATATATAAQSTNAPAAPAATTSIVEEVSAFYAGYLSALGEGQHEEAKALREANLTAELRDRLADWEAQSGADGVTRSQNVPVQADVVYDGSGMGHSWTIVTLRWDSDAAPTQLHVQSDLATRKISDIKTLD